MTCSRIASASALLALISAPAAAAPLSPSGKWVVNFDDAQCIASRNYGVGKKMLALVLKPSPLGDITQLSVVRSRSFGYTEQTAAKLTIDALPPIPASLLGFTVTQSKLRVDSVILSKASFAQLRGGHSLRIAAPMELIETFALSGMEGVTKALDTCVADLQRVWNIDAAGLAKVKQGPQATVPLVTLFDSDDYPIEALRSGTGGSTRFAILVDEKGAIGDCMVTESSGVAVLDAQSCAVVKERAKFAPGIGVDGATMKSGFLQTVLWKPSR